MSRELLRQALDALDYCPDDHPDVLTAFEAISAELAKPEPEPVAWRVRRHDAPEYWIVFLHKPVDALEDPGREVQPLYAIKETP